MNRVNVYPVKVIVEFEGDEVWSGRQQALFGKNAGQRKQSIKEIEKAITTAMAASAALAAK
jgi:hypothetical protein